MVADTVRIKMYRTRKSGTRIVKALHGLRKVKRDPQFELDTAAHLREQLSREQLLADIGVSSIILPEVTGGREAIVGARAVLTEDVPGFATVAGVPARVIDRRKHQVP